ncbi:MAG TPA: chemotaxis protein CheW [Chthoniobacteraceae bacterium]|jgi:purine-binding chemotaxis protein CheW
MRDYCTLTLAGQTYAVELRHLREVLAPLPSTPLPLAPEEIRGVMNLRGELVPILVLDRWLRLGTAETSLQRRPWLAVMEAEQRVFAALVDRVGTARVEEEELSPPELEDQRFDGFISTLKPRVPLICLTSLFASLEGRLRQPLASIPAN